MPKYKSTAAYRQVDALNKEIKSVYVKFGPESELYEMYVNKLSAALPPNTVHISKGGFIQVTKSKKSGLSAQNIKSARKGLPTVSRASSKYKREIAAEKLVAKGVAVPSEVEIQKEAKSVTAEEIKKYSDAKSYVKSKEDSKGKLIYSASVKSLMETLGAKSYELLEAILKEGESRENAEAQKEAANAAAVEQSYENGKASLTDQG